MSVCITLPFLLPMLAWRVVLLDDDDDDDKVISCGGYFWVTASEDAWLITVFSALWISAAKRGGSSNHLWPRQPQKRRKEKYLKGRSLYWPFVNEEQENDQLWNSERHSTETLQAVCYHTAIRNQSKPFWFRKHIACNKTTVLWRKFIFSSGAEEFDAITVSCG